MFFLHLAHFHLGKSLPLYEPLSKQFKKFFTSTEAKKKNKMPTAIITFETKLF